MKKILILLISLLFVTDAFAQDAGSGLDFLNVGPSARLLSIGDATSATSTGSSAIYSNPALLIMESESSVDLSYTSWVAEVTNQFAAVNLLRGNYALAFGVYNSRSDGFEARSQPGDSDGEFSISYLSLSGAAAYNFGPFSAGLTLQYIREEIFQLRANGYAVSGGLAAEFLDHRVRVGAAVQNLGQMEELDFQSTRLPSLFRVGTMANLISFSTPGYNDLPILLSIHADYIVPIEQVSTSDFIESDQNDDFLSLALSADVADLFYIQGGYKFGPTERPVSLGAGFNIYPLKVNYALLPFSTGFGTAHSVGIQFYF